MATCESHKEMGDEDLHIYTTICKIDGQWKLRCVAQGAQSVLCGDLDGGDRGGRHVREVQEGRDRCIHTADSLHHTAETTLQSTYSPKNEEERNHVSLSFIVLTFK